MSSGIISRSSKNNASIAAILLAALSLSFVQAKQPGRKNAAGKTSTAKIQLGVGPAGMGHPIPINLICPPSSTIGQPAACTVYADPNGIVSGESNYVTLDIDFESGYGTWFIGAGPRKLVMTPTTISVPVDNSTGQGTFSVLATGSDNVTITPGSDNSSAPPQDNFSDIIYFGGSPGGTGPIGPGGF